MNIDTSSTENISETIYSSLSHVKLVGCMHCVQQKRKVLPLYIAVYLKSPTGYAEIRRLNYTLCQRFEGVCLKGVISLDRCCRMDMGSCRYA